MKTCLRALCLLLALLTLSMVIVACDAGAGNTDEQGGGNGGLIDDRYDVNGRLRDDLPDTLNYEGETISFMRWGDASYPEFEQENVTGDNVRDAVYDRNNQIEDRLNVELKFTTVPGPFDPVGSAAYIKHLDAIYQANTQDYDIIASYSRTQGSFAVQGYLQNLAAIENSYIDLEKPWWPQQLVETVSFGSGGYYFISGDMSTNVLYMMHLMFLNKDMFSMLQLELPYQSVYDGTWTIDKMIALASGVYNDLDRNNQMSDGDRYGFTAKDYVMDSFYIGSNLHWVDEHETDWLVLSPDYTSAKTVKLINKLGSFAATEDAWIGSQTVRGSDSQAVEWKLFEDGKALISMQHANYAEARLLDAEFEYGLVPVPKYDEKQVNYYTGMGNPWTLYGIFVDFNDRGDKQATLTMLTAVLECFASEAYRLTTPEVFEVNMQLKYATGQTETDMFEFIRSGITFDIGKIFGNELSNISEQPSKAIAANASWSATSGAYKRAITAQVAEIVQSFRDYQAIRDK